MNPKREVFLNEAKSWLGTPFHHEAMVKGAGCDCGKFLIGVGSNVGFIPVVTVPHYPPDFAFHRDREWYVELLQEWCTEISGSPEPGDIVLFKQGRLFSHGAIVVDWPRMIHAFVPRGVAYADGTQGKFRDRPVRFFRPRAFEE